MKYKLSHLIAVAIGAMSLASCGPKLTSTTVPMSTSGATVRGDSNLTRAIESRVNAYRSSKGRSVLRRNAGLDRMARQHSEFMRANRGKFQLGKSANISHYGFTERSLAAQRTLGMANVGENVATCGGRGSESASTLVNAWVKSSGHEKNMKGKWDTTGIGVVVDSDGTVFATQIFASENHSHMALTDRMRQF